MNDSVNTAVNWQTAGPAWVWVLAAGAVLTAIALSYRREARAFPADRCTLLAALRCLAALMLVTMLAGPALQRRRLGQPRLVVLVDRSTSMATGDVPLDSAAPSESPGFDGSSGGPLSSRAAAAGQWLAGGSPARWRQLQQDYDVQVIGFDESAQPLTLEEVIDQPLANKEETLRGTRLGDVVADSLAAGASPPAAIVILSDGIVTAGVPLATAGARARALGVPLFAVAIGSERPRPDIAVDGVLVEPIVFPGDRVPVEARIRAREYAGRTVDVALQIDGETAATTTVELRPDGQSAAVRLTWRPTAAGLVNAAVLVSPLADEANAANNRAAFSIRVRSEPIRVLLAAAAPSFEFRALKSLLERDPAIRLSAFLQEADAEFAEVDEAAVRDFPATAADFTELDVAILGDLDPDLLPPGGWDPLRAFVTEQGGGMAVIAGPQYMPFAYRSVPPMQTLLPIATDSINPLRVRSSDAGAWRIRPTAAGQAQILFQLGDSPAATAAIWEALPPVYWLLAPVELKPGAEVLAAAEPVPSEDDATRPAARSQPAIVRHFVGAGEVLMHLTDETWRWRYRNDDRFFLRYWGQAVRRLARGRLGRGQVQLTTDRADYEAGEPVVLRAVVPGAGQGGAVAATAVVSGETTGVRRVSLAPRPERPQVLESVLAGLSPDRYTARLADDVAVVPVQFTIERPPDELTRLAVDWAALAQAARLTGGQAVRWEHADELTALLPPPMPAVVERLPPEPLWNRPWAIGGLVALLSVEWFIRRRSGMA